MDDSALTRRNLRTCLEGAGYEVEEASDGLQALEAFHLRRHGLVLLDIVMPGISGLEVLSQLRIVDPSVRVIMITSDRQPQTIAKAKDAGAAGYCTKPIKRLALLALIETVLAGRTGWPSVPLSALALRG